MLDGFVLPAADETPKFGVGVAGIKNLATTAGFAMESHIQMVCWIPILLYPSKNFEKLCMIVQSLDIIGTCDSAKAGCATAHGIQS